MVQATAYGDNFRIQIQQKQVDQKKSSLSVNQAVPTDGKDKVNGPEEQKTPAAA